MFIHTLAVRLKPDAADAQLEQAKASLHALQGQIPGLLNVFAGENVSPRSQAYSLVVSMQFADRASLRAYDTHPAHQAVVPAVVAVAADILELDYEV